MVKEAVAEQPSPPPEFPVKRDSRNPVFGRKIAEIVSLMTFRKPGRFMRASGVTFPISTEDLQASPTIRRLLPKVQPPHFGIAIDSGSYLPDKEDPYNTGFLVKLGHVSILMWEPAPQVARLIRDFRIDIDAGRMNLVDSDYPILAGVSFTRQLRGKEADLLGKRSKTAEKVLSELEIICLQQRENFASTQEQRLQGLNSADRGMVDALKEVGMEIYQGSKNRGFYDEFLLGGRLDEQGRLNNLILGFSAASDRRDETHWKDTRYLNAFLARRSFSWKEDKEEKAGTASISEGKVLVKQVGNEKPIREVPIEVAGVEREGASYPNTVSGLTTRFFFHFLMDRVGIISSDEPSPLLLATSLPLYPKG